MNRTHWLLALALLLAGCSSQEQTKDDEEPKEKPAIGKRALHYKVSVDDTRERTLRVEVAFRTEETGETTLVVPKHTIGEEKKPAVTDLEALSKNTDIGKRRDNGLYPIRHDPKSLVRVRYRLRGLPTPDKPTNRYGPYALEHGWYFEGETVFAHPKSMHPGLERPIQLDWRELPEGWQAVDSLGTPASLQELKTALGAIQNSMFVLGNLQHREADVSASTVTVAMLGEDTPDEKSDALSALSDGVVSLVREQQAFWSDSELPPYLIATFTPGGCCWSIGTTKYHAIATVVAQKKREARKETLHPLVAHEHLHRWIPSKIGSPRPFHAYAWFVEGFTEFYARRFLVRAGLLAPSAYVEQINGLLEKYANNPKQTADRTEVNHSFRTNTQVRQLAYQRGELLALNWHTAIREATNGEKSLDDVMRRLAQKHAEDDEFRLSDETFRKTLHEVTPEVDVRPVIKAHIEEGTPVEVAENALGPCATKTKSDGGATFEAVEGIDESEKCREWLAPH